MGARTSPRPRGDARRHRWFPGLAEPRALPRQAPDQVHARGGPRVGQCSQPRRAVAIPGQLRSRDLMRAAALVAWGMVVAGGVAASGMERACGAQQPTAARNLLADSADGTPIRAAARAR